MWLLVHQVNLLIQINQMIMLLFMMLHVGQVMVRCFKNEVSKNRKSDDLKKLQMVTRLDNRMGTHLDQTKGLRLEHQTKLMMAVLWMV